MVSMNVPTTIAIIHNARFFLIHLTASPPVVHNASPISTKIIPTTHPDGIGGDEYMLLVIMYKPTLVDMNARSKQTTAMGLII
jgi:hypothetical protein